MNAAHALGLALATAGCVNGREAPSPVRATEGPQPSATSVAPASDASSTSGTARTSSGESSGASIPDADASSSSAAPSCVDATEFTVPPGLPVVVDGRATAGEWADARPYTVEPEEGWVASVGLKHDGRVLAVVFHDFLPPSAPPAVAFPELLLDVGNDKAMSLGPDDWWFHVSFTDCAAVGEYDNYDDCVPEAQGWEANNFGGGSPLSTVEVRIDFATLGLDPTLEQDLGLLLRLSDTQGFASHWPQTGDPDDPSTWATVRLCL